MKHDSSTELITVSEAVKIAVNKLSLKHLETAVNIFEETQKAFIDEGSTQQFATMCALTAVFDSGRINGIRETRAKKK